MKILTAEPHIAGSPEDYKTALYVAQKFREAGLDTTIVPYRVWLNYPGEVSVKAYSTAGTEIMSGPSPEQVDSDPFQNNAAVTPAFSGYSPSGDVTADVVYANYGRPEDFKALAEQGVNVRGKIVIVRYGENFRGVKAYRRRKWEPPPSSSIPTPSMTASPRAILIPRDRGVPAAVCSEARSNSDSSILAIPLLPDSPAPCR